MASVKKIWLRRGIPSDPNSCGAWHDLRLSVIGNAAARETFVTATPHMASIWTDLFRSMITSGRELRWLGHGPGIGRDARIAYSSLLGRYMARAYLTEHARVRVLVPLDAAKRHFLGTPYVLGKDPPGRGLEADWIGIDDEGLVIVEAKGTFNTGVRPWHGPSSTPQILRTAIEQADRTAVFVGRYRRKLPAKRWAIASRWSTEVNGREPTLLAWDPEEEKLGEDDYHALAKILLRADVRGVMRGLGHSETEQILDDTNSFHGIPGVLRLRVGEQVLEPGFAAMVGPFGVHPMRRKNDLLQVLRAHELNLNFSVASLSSRYANAVWQGLRWPDEARTDDEWSAIRAGLTVVWPTAGQDVLLAEE